MNQQLPVFQDFLYAHIPLVKSMQMELSAISEQFLLAQAPLAPNINDKKTVFGGSSAALMTVCGWSLIKFQLEQRGVFNDVVIYQANTQWKQAQTDDLIIKVQTQKPIDWQQICHNLITDKKKLKIDMACQVLNQNNEICCSMLGNYVVLCPQRSE